MENETIDYAVLLKNTLNELLALLAGDDGDANEVRLNLVRTALDYSFYLEDRSKP